MIELLSEQEAVGGSWPVDKVNWMPGCRLSCELESATVISALQKKTLESKSSRNIVLQNSLLIKCDSQRKL